MPGIRVKLLALLAGSLGWSQTPANPPAEVVSPAEVIAQDTPIVFQSRVNLVLVPAVVRDKAGKAVDNLRQEDFQLFDNGKPQVITKFSVEKSGGKTIRPAQAIPSKEASLAETGAPAAQPPDHFVAWLFDDVNLEVADLTRVRDAALKYLGTSFRETDRRAIYTTSGQTTLDFTDDRAQLQRVLMQIRPHPISRTNLQMCPDLSFYVADLIQNKNDAAALDAATQQAIACLGLDPTMPSNVPIARATAQRVASLIVVGGEHEVQVLMGTLKEVVRHMSAMPGQRTLVLLSPGFQRLSDQLPEESAIMDLAIRTNVTINALDARGVYTNTADITKWGGGSRTDIRNQGYDNAAAFTQSHVLAELAYGTGGTFFQNSNDLTLGVERLSATPDVYYVLGYVPQNLKMDGAYHTIKVSVKIPSGLSTQARHGYYAPSHQADAAEEAKEEISAALFSREEMRDIPVEMHTQFFKASEAEARLAILARVDVRKLRFRKAGERNGDVMTVVSGLFDRNGTFVGGITKTVTMRLKDETLQGKLDSGVLVRSDFKVAPGRYAIRLVIRDSEGQMMAAQNGAVEIP